MIEIVKEKVFQAIALVITLLTVFTVNSACLLGLGQEEEPESLSRFKKL